MVALNRPAAYNKLRFARGPENFKYSLRVSFILICNLPQCSVPDLIFQMGRWCA